MLGEGLTASTGPFQAALGSQTRKLPPSLAFPALRRLFSGFKEAFLPCCDQCSY